MPVRNRNPAKYILDIFSSINVQSDVVRLTWDALDMVLSIVIGTYNRMPVLRQCLDSLIGKVKIQHEIIVVDAGSTDGTREYLRTLQGIRFICDAGLLGQAKSLNRVFASVKGKYVCWLSDDNIILPGMLDQAVSILRRDPEIGLVALKVKDMTGPLADQDYLGGIWATGVLNCNQGILSVQLLTELGGFDENFRDYGIDIDLTTRVLLKGYKVVFTKQVAVHHLRDHDSESWTDSSGRKQKMEDAKELYAQKYESLIKCDVDGRYDKAERKKAPLLQLIFLYYSRAKKRGISRQDVIELAKRDLRILLVLLGSWKGLNERDWRNLFMARFISRLDFLFNLMRPYYLVQRIPGIFLESLEGKKQ